MSKETARARFRQAVLDMRDVVRHGNQEVLNRHTDDALMFGDAYAAEALADPLKTLERLVAALEDYAIVENTDGNGQCLMCQEVDDHKADCLIEEAAVLLAGKEKPP
jgi:hypothetical protein